MHQCPIYGCVAMLPHDTLMCRGHWFMVPPRLRMEVYSAWAAGHPTQMYPVYRARAIAAVEYAQDKRGT